jgi:peptidoglycan/LPS O-acetylase OafA/YrhL
MGAAHHFGPNWLSATWSLAVEEQFYLLLPLIVHFLPGRGAWVAAISGLALGPACRLLVGGGLASYTLLPCRFDALMSGAVVALAFENRSIRDWIAGDRIFVPTLLAAAAVGGLVLIKQGASFDRIFTVPGTLLLSCIDFAGALLLAWVIARPAGRLARFFSWGPLTAAGLWSYGLYLVHEPLLGLAHGWLLGSEPVLRTGVQALVTLAAAVASVGVAIFLYNTLERPCMGYARRFHY